MQKARLLRLQRLNMLPELLHLMLIKLLLLNELGLKFASLVDIVILQVDYLGLLGLEDLLFFSQPLLLRLYADLLRVNLLLQFAKLCFLVLDLF